jgi:hypothetical protein
MDHLAHGRLAGAGRHDLGRGAENTLTAEIRDKARRNLERHALVKPNGPRSSTDIDGSRGSSAHSMGDICAERGSYGSLTDALKLESLLVWPPKTNG